MQAATGHMSKTDYETYTKELKGLADEHRSPGRSARPDSHEAIAAMGGTAVVVEG